MARGSATRFPAPSARRVFFYGKENAMNIMLRRRPVESTMTNGFPTMGRLFNDLFADPFFSAPLGVVSPPENLLPLDVAETEKEFVVTADLPGFKKEEITLEIESGVLTLKGETKIEKEEESADGPKYHRRERRIESVTRSISLPEGVLEDKVTADLKDGVLTVTLPKAPAALARKIAIK
jgi:HSP20 family protein